MQRWRKLLLPFSWLYGAVISVRNLLYDWEVFSAKTYEIPIVCIGNLTVGGTGKTPMTEYIAKLLETTYKTAILSRGYKRATKGFVLADKSTTVRSLGDEPFQYHLKLPQVTVAVDEDRRHGIERLTTDSQVEVVLLDDGYQHRKVKPGLLVLLTMYDDLYVDDLLLPAGNLRDSKSQAKRADIVVVTKCPQDLDTAGKDAIAKRLMLSESQQLYFSTILYSHSVHSHKNSMTLDDFKAKPVVLVTGIAKPQPLLDYLVSQGVEFTHLEYPDHHNFSPKEVAFLKKQQNILTTEKDFMRLCSHLDGLYYLPIRVAILGDEELFNKAIFAGVRAG